MPDLAALDLEADDARTLNGYYKVDLCSACRVDELCPACGQLAPATHEQRTNLPKELALAGAAVLTGTDTDATRSCSTAETRLSRRSSEMDLSTDGLRLADPPLTTRTCCVFRPADNSVRRLFQSSNSLRRRCRLRNRVLLLNRGAPITPCGRSMLSACRAAANLVRYTGPRSRSAVGDSFPPVRRLPHAVPEGPSQVRNALPSMNTPPTAELEVRWERAGQDLTMTPSGHSTRTIEGSGAHATPSTGSIPTNT